MARGSEAIWGSSDFVGSPEGGNAIYALSCIIETLRANSDTPIQAFFDDLPTNDFNHLFRNLFDGSTPALRGPEIYTAALGGSAFGRLVPSCSLHVATTFNAIGFLERKPDAPLPGYILPMGPGPRAPRKGVGVTDAEREPFARQAARDLEQFYGARAEELARGGKLLVPVSGRNESTSTSFGIYDVLSDALLDGVDEGVLPLEVYSSLVFPIYFRSLDELPAPVTGNGLFAGKIRVEESASLEVPAPFNTAFETTGDREAWAGS